MALTLRELLDKQRAEREARESMAQGLMKPETTVGKTFVAEIKTPPEEKNFASGFVRDQYNMPVKDMNVPTPQPPKPKLGLFGSLSGGGNADQSSSQVSEKAQVGMQTTLPDRSRTQAQSGEGSSPRAGLPNGHSNANAGSTQTAQVGLASIPTFTVDETEQLRQNLAFLAANLDEAAILPQVLRTTVNQIRQHPELNAVLVNDDFDLIIAAAKRSTKYAARKKEDKTEARGKKQNAKAELDQWLRDQGIEL